MKRGSILVSAIAIILPLIIQSVVMAQVEIEGYVQTDSRISLEHIVQRGLHRSLWFSVA